VSVSFSGNELIDIAIGIERRGIAFYDIMTRSTDSAEARDIFQHLADMEREHMQIFEAMRNQSEKFQPAETYEGEHEAYLQALADSAVFTDDVITSELASQADSDIEALELAINAEKDSLLFYYQIQPTVDRILTEEKSHLTQLTALKKRLSGPV